MTVAPFPRSALVGEEWQWLRTLLLLRCGGRCEATGDRLVSGRWSVQHRRARGMGGTRQPDVHSLANLMVVTGDGTRGVHGWIEAHPAHAARLGWRVAQGVDPATVPLSLWSGRRVALDPLNPLYLPPADGRLYEHDMPNLASLHT
jgi:hypothetical protein